MLKAYLNILFVLILCTSISESGTIDDPIPDLDTRQTDFLEAPSIPFQSGEIGHGTRSVNDYSVNQLGFLVSFVFIFLILFKSFGDFTIPKQFHPNSRYLFLENRVLLI